MMSWFGAYLVAWGRAFLPIVKAIGDWMLDVIARVKAAP